MKLKSLVEIKEKKEGKVLHRTQNDGGGRRREEKKSQSSLFAKQLIPCVKIVRPILLTKFNPEELVIICIFVFLLRFVKILLLYQNQYLYYF